MAEVYRFNANGEIIGTYDTIATRLSRGGREARLLWLLCFYCRRFFQAKHVRRDFQGNREGCAFCGAAGFEIALHAYDAWATPAWPPPEQLYHGKSLPYGL